MIRFVVEGNPIPKARPRVITTRTGTRAYTPSRTKRWERLVAQAAARAMDGRPPLEGPVGVKLRFYRKDRRRVDGDNLEKSAADPLNGVVWLDDSQVVECHRYMGLDRERPRVEVEVWEVEDIVE